MTATTNPGAPRVMLLDIEATNLSADFGYVLCIAWKFAGQRKVYCIDITQSPTFEKDPTNDAWLVDEFRKIVEEQADVVVFHYGSIFDYPFLQTRALFNKLTLFPRIPFIDTWRIARKGLALHSNRLASIASLLGADEKTALNGPIWIKAMSGNRDAIAYVVKHCKQDVVVLDQVYERIKGLRADNPRLNHGVANSCPTCRSTSIQMRGRARTLAGLKQRYSCNDCGHWWSK